MQQRPHPLYLCIIRDFTHQLVLILKEEKTDEETLVQAWKLDYGKFDIIDYLVDDYSCM